jgi:hypothetical protein
VNPDAVIRPVRGWHNRPIVRETDERRVRHLWRVLFAVIVAITPTAVYLVQQNECVKMAYEVSDLEVSLENLVKTEMELKAQAVGLESLERIERWAIRERGLEQPASEDVVVVGTEGDGALPLLAIRQGRAKNNEPPR